MEHAYFELFKTKKPLIGMIHCAGSTHAERLERALNEITMYEEEGMDGIIVEDYHGMRDDVCAVLHAIGHKPTSLITGINLLSNPYESFNLAHVFGASFIQFDSVQPTDLDEIKYASLREKYPQLLVLGGIGFKYTRPTRNDLVEDLDYGKKRVDAIVTTGDGTGIETPLEKLRAYKTLLKDFPLLVGAGVTYSNAYEQLRIADGAIIGSYFKKDNNTQNNVDREKVRQLVSIAKRFN
jgi:uncharacterized protein